MSSEKIIIIPGTIVHGNNKQFNQYYSFGFMPMTLDLSPKLCLDVDTDIHNSLRFENTSDAFIFVRDAFYSYMLFLEKSVQPMYREQFRLMNLQQKLNLIMQHCISEWKKKETIKQQNF